MFEHETYTSSACHGVVHDPPSCPIDFVPTIDMQGNLQVRSVSESGMGGNFHVQGPCSDDGCRDSGLFNMTIDGSIFHIYSAGSISLHSANSDGANSKGSDILLKSGDGINPIGGTGGDITLLGGTGSSGKRLYINELFVSSKSTHN